jgi:predicted GNAT superfamily acetyltransferase
VIRPFAPGDEQALIELNTANMPEVGPMDADKLAMFAEISPFFVVVEIHGDVVGMLIGLTETEEVYPSTNYRWFAGRNNRFAYVDRIALSESIRGQGWGPDLYRQFEAWAVDADKPVLCAEVNTIPANPRSIRFHEIFGFVDVARRKPYGPDEEVAMFEKVLHATGE